MKHVTAEPQHYIHRERHLGRHIISCRKAFQKTWRNHWHLHASTSQMESKTTSQSGWGEFIFFAVWACGCFRCLSGFLAWLNYAFQNQNAIVLFAWSILARINHIQNAPKLIPRISCSDPFGNPNRYLFPKGLWETHWEIIKHLGA